MTSSAPRSDDGEPVDPEKLFDEYLQRREREGDGVLEELCARHPAAADDLRRLGKAFAAMDDAVDALGDDQPSSLTPRLLPSDDESIGPVDDPTGVLLDALERSKSQPSVDADDGAWDPTVAIDPSDAGGRGGPGGPSSGSSVGSVVERLTQGSSRYAAGREIARGGMGAILKTWDGDLRRYLAMKVMLPGAEGEESSSAERRIGRFLEEAQITGQLDHPGIVPVHELGRDESGNLYFTMRFVRGMSFARVVELVTASKDVRAKRDEWTTTRALGVLRQVCDTLAYAHNKGVVHRDIKPANIMVGRFGEVYVMDWGLAKVTGRPDTHDLRPAVVDGEGSATPRPRAGPPTGDAPPGDDDSLVSTSFDDNASLSQVQSDRRLLGDADPDSPLRTMDGAVVGTPAYMSPEQARGSLDEIGPATDIYAVGALMYFLLTGSAPYCDGEERLGPHAILREVRSGPPTPLLQLTRDIPGELVSITEKAMARRPDQRYADMTEMAADLRAFLERRVVRAYKTGAFAELSKWVLRNKLTAGVLIAALLLLGTAAVQLYRSGERASERAFEAEQATLAAEQANTDLARSNAERGEALDALEQSNEQLSETLAENEAMVYSISLAAALERLEHGELDDALALLERCPPAERGWEWQHLRLRAECSLGLLETRERGVVAIDSAPSTGLAAVLSDDGRVHVWDVARRVLVTRLEVGEAARGLAFHPGGRLLATGDARGRLVLWDVFSGAVRHERTRLGDEASVGALVFHPDGERLFAGFDNGELYEWAVGSGRERVYYDGPGAPVRSLAIEPEGDFLVSGSDHGFAVLWFVPDGRAERYLEGHQGSVGGVAWSPAERWIATACDDGVVRVFDLSERGGDTRRLLADAPVSSVAFAPDGRSLVAGRADGGVLHFDAYRNERLAVWRGHRADVAAVSFDADGERVLSADADGVVQLWDPDFADGSTRLGDHADEIGSMAVAPDGARVALGTLDGRLHLWDGGLLHELALRELGGDAAPAVAFAPDGRGLAVSQPRAADGRHGVQLWDLAAAGLAEQPRAVLPGHDDLVGHLAFGPRGDWLASAAVDEVVVWDVAAERQALSLSLRDARVAFHPAQPWAVAGGSEGVLGVLDPAAGVARSVSLPDARPILDLAFDSRGTRLAIARADAVLVLDAVTLQRRQRLAREGERPLAVAWQPGSRRLAVATSRGELGAQLPGKLRVWQAEQGRELLTLRLDAPTPRLAFDAAGQGLLVGRRRHVQLLQTTPPSEGFEARKAAAARAVQARALVDDLLTLHVDPREVATLLRRDATLDEGLRAEALRVVRDFGSDPRRLADDAWTAVLDERAGHAVWSDALRRARAADRLAPGTARILCVLGAAYTRLHETSEALRALELAQDINAIEHDHPESWARFFLGFAFLDDDRPRRARNELDAALRLLDAEVMQEGFSASDSRQLEAQARQLMPLVETLAAERDA